MGTSSSKEPEDDRGVKGFFADIVAANQVAPYFRFEGCQLFFASISAGSLTDQTYKHKGLVGVKRVKLDGSDALPGGAFKTLTHRQFQKVLKRMQSEADVALQAQIALRGWVEPDRERAERIMMEDGRIVSLQEATAKGAIHEAEQPVGNKRHSKEEVAARAGGGRDGTLQAPQVFVSVSANGAGEAWIEEDHGVGAGRPSAAAAPAVTAEGGSPTHDCEGGGREEGDGEEEESAHAREEERQEARGNMAEVVNQEDAGAAGGVDRERGKKKRKKKKKKKAGEDKEEGDVGRERGGSEGAEPEGCEEAGGVAAAAAAAHDDDDDGGGGGGGGGDDDAEPRGVASTAEREEGDTIREEEGDGGAPQTPRREQGAAGTCETPGGGQATPGGTRIADGRLVKVQREEYECMICLQTTGSGISLPCLHGPFCEGCLSVWSRHNRSCPCCRRKTGYDDDDCWVHLEEPELEEIVKGLYGMIRKL